MLSRSSPLPATHYMHCPLGVAWLQGFLPADTVPLQTQADQAQASLQRLYEAQLPLLHLPETQEDLAEIEAHAERLRAHSDTLVLVGIGGSSLGALALTALAENADPMRFRLMENPDPGSIDNIMRECDPARTSWLFVSKSGGTLETLSQVMIILSWLHERIGKEEIARRCLAITEPKDSALTRRAAHFAIPPLAHEAELGGRWSCISNVGLLPAAICGVDIRAFRSGANAMLQHALNSDTSMNQAMQGALYCVLQNQLWRDIHVVMPYADRLAATASWYRQLISESVGKNGKGITPLAALGTVDQHSMLQLMLDGPDDKFFTIITSSQKGEGPCIDPALAWLCGLEYLANVPVGNVLAAFEEGTIGSIKASGRPIRTIHLERVDAYHLGALLMYFMLETVYIAELLKVNAFDQPAVEDSKVRAKFLLRNEA